MILCQLTHFSRFFIDRKIGYFNSHYRDHEVDDTITYRRTFLAFLILEDFRPFYYFAINFEVDRSRYRTKWEMRSIRLNVKSTRKKRRIRTEWKIFIARHGASSIRHSASNRITRVPYQMPIESANNRENRVHNWFHIGFTQHVRIIHRWIGGRS